MNYRHAYHAGNFADVMKHAVLMLVIEHLKRKPTPFRVIDTHAGIGSYDLAGVEAQKTGEWRDGIGRLFGALAAPALPPPAHALLAPYLDAVRAVNPTDAIVRYPGSPLLALMAMRGSDRLVANELHPADSATLRALLRHDRRAKVLALDGWTALKSLLPPKERRGVILVDPPFEQPGDLDRLVSGLREAMRRFATGVYLLWHPIKDPRPVAAMRAAIGTQSRGHALAAELLIRAPADPTRLNGAGLVIVNPPHPLTEALPILLTTLAERLAQGPGAVGRVLPCQDDAAPAAGPPVSASPRPDSGQRPRR